MLELSQHNITFLRFSESCQEYVEIMLHLFCRLGIDFGSYAFHIFDRSPPEGFDELDVILLTPVAEALVNVFLILVLELIWDDFEVILELLDFQGESLNFLQIWVELELMNSLRRNAFVLLRNHFPFTIF